MVSIEFEKPSTWSIGKMIAAIAIILLIVGPFLPYAVSEVRGGDTELTGDINYMNYDMWGLWMFIPFLSALLIIILLYFKLDIYIHKGSNQVKINHYILMTFGFWFFLTYLFEGLQMESSLAFGGTSYNVYGGIGLWLIVAGFFLCIIVGFLEWRYPSVSVFKVPKVGLPKKKEPEVVGEESAEQVPEVVTTVEPEKVQTESMIEEEEPKAEPSVEPEPSPTVAAKPVKVEEPVKELTSEEEKTLQRWARHINRDGQTFEKCMKCDNYTFINAKDTGDSILFKCPDCNASFTLKK